MLFRKDARSRQRAVLSKGMEIHGTIRCEGVLVVHAQVTGTIDHDGLLVISSGARCGNDIRARSLRVAGMVQGRVRVRDKLEILPGGCVDGNVECAVLQIHPGGSLRGSHQIVDGESGAAVADRNGHASRAPDTPELRAASEEPAATPTPGANPATPIDVPILFRGGPKL